MHKMLGLYIDPDEIPMQLSSDEIKQKAHSGFCPETIKFQLLMCEYDYFKNCVYLKGRTAEGISVVVKVLETPYYFYLQRQKPFENLDDVAETLSQIQSWYFQLDSYTVNSNTKTPSIARTKKWKDSDQIVQWTWLQKRHKTLYGFTPDDYYEDIVKVWVKKASIAREFHKFFESPEFLALNKRDDKASMIRTFEACIDPALRYRIDHNVVMGRWCSSNCFIVKHPIDGGFFSDVYLEVEHNFLWCDITNNEIAPLKIMSFDIECAGKILPGGDKTRFPVPLWSTDRCRKYAEATLGLVSPFKSKNWKSANWIQWIRSQISDDELCIDPRDTDPVVIICASVRIFGRDKDLDFTSAHALVYKHPAASPVDRSAIDAHSQTWQYYKIELQQFDSESALLVGFQDLIHRVQPDIITGWNTARFDFPYLWDRADWLGRYGTEKDIERTSKVNFGLKINENSRCVQKFSTTRVGGDNIIREITVPFVIHDDGIVVWKHSSYGQPKEISFALNHVASKHLSYPLKYMSFLQQPKVNDGLPEVPIEGCQKESSKVTPPPPPPPPPPATATTKKSGGLKPFPMRKLEFNIYEGTPRWKKGGRAFWEFVVYCYVDACLPILLLEERGKIGLEVALARSLNANLKDIYNKGVQMKLLSSIYTFCRNLYDGTYLVPDKGTKYFHWPGVFEHPQGILHALCHFRRLQPRKEGEVGYMGAKVFEPLSRGIIANLVTTKDFTSLYPTIMASYCLCYINFLNEFLIKKFDLKRYEYFASALGPADIIHCGEKYYDPDTAVQDGYATASLKRAFWYQREDNIFGSIIKTLFASRVVAKKHLAQANAAVKLLDPFVKSNMDMLNIRDRLTPQYQEALDSGIEGMELFKMAEKDVDNFDNEQLAYKLCLNSLYGFTTSSSGILPLAELGATVTAIGRREIKRAACIAERITVTAARMAAKKRREYAAQHRNDNDKEGYSVANISKIPWNTVFHGITKSGTKLTPEQRKYYRKNCISCPTLRFMSQQDVEESYPLISTGGFRVVYGDTDSIMVDQTSSVTDIQEAEDNSSYISYMINRYMLNMMGIVHEKTAQGMLLFKRKKYIMRLVVSRESNKVEYLWKGVEPQRRDTLPWANNIIKTSTKRLLDAIGTRAYINNDDGDDDNADNDDEFTDETNMMSTTLGSSNESTSSKFSCVDPSRKFDQQVYSSATTNTTTAKITEKAIKDIKNYISKELHQFATGQVSVDDLTLSKRYSKVKYKTEPEHLGAVAKRTSRGEQVDVGSRIPYLFVYPKFDSSQAMKLMHQKRGRSAASFNQNFLRNNYKGKDLAEDPEFAVKNDLEIAYDHIFESKAKKPISRWLRHIIAPVSNFPEINDERMTPEEKKMAKKQQEMVERKQDMVVSRELFQDVHERFQKRRKLNYASLISTCYSGNNDENSQRTLSGYLNIRPESECEICFNFFRGKEKICSSCIDNHTILANTHKDRLVHLENRHKKSWDTCRKCVALTGLPNIDPASCRLFTCSNYSKRNRIGKKIQLTRRHLELLSTDW